MAVAQWIRRWSSDHRVVQAEGSRHLSNIFSAMIFISVLLGLIDFIDMVMLRSGPNLVVANKTLSVLICIYYH